MALHSMKHGEIGAIEWVPGKWWIVEATGDDGSLTPLAGPFDNRKQANDAIAADTRFQPVT